MVVQCNFDLPYRHAAAFIAYNSGSARQILLLDCKNSQALRCSFSDKLVNSIFDNVEILDDIADEHADSWELYAFERTPVKPEAVRRS